MGMSGAQFSQQYGQAGVQQMGTPGVNGQQLQNKVALSNNLPQFSTELKGAGSVPNMVSVKYSLCFSCWRQVSPTKVKRCKEKAEKETNLFPAGS